MKARQLLFVVMDGVGVRADRFGNAVALARTPHLNALKEKALFTTLQAHGTSVGMPAESDLGNSEVGHNAIGAGRIFDQGAKLVDLAIDSKKLFSGSVWKNLVAQVKTNGKTLHFLGLLSDGNVHSHEKHLFAMMREAAAEGVKRIRVHVLFDGRDVGESTAEIYLARLEAVIAELDSKGIDCAIASGGGRMVVTMDRYEADWRIVERGWHAHVLGEAEHRFEQTKDILPSLRQGKDNTDQYLPAFVMCKNAKPIGLIEDHDAVIFFNFRGDRAIEISRAFTETDFHAFNRVRVPKVFYAGMMQYDGDLKIPANYLVDPPLIEDTLGEYLARLGLRQFACSETQKYGHVTFFWNGNRSNKFNDALEEYVEIPSDQIPFDQRPQMKAREISAVTIEHLERKTFDFARINFANGDMVGHTGNLSAAIVAMEVVDECIGHLVAACQKADCALMVTADHGNCDEMFEDKSSKYPDWEKGIMSPPPKPKTAHTTNPVPFYFYEPRTDALVTLRTLPTRGLANLANTILSAMRLKERSIYLPSLIEVKQR